MRLSPADIRELRDALDRVGAFERHSGIIWFRFAAMLCLSAALATAALLSPWWLTVVLLPLASLALTIGALYGHEGGHKSLSTNNAENALMLHLAFPVLGGLGAVHWSAKHNVGHHGHPNVIGGPPQGDPDINLWPMATSTLDYEASGPGQRWFQRNLQGWAFWPLTSLLVFSMRVESFIALRRHLRTRGADRTFWLDVVSLAAHYALWLVIPSFIFGFLATFAFYVAVWLPVGLYLAGIFVGAHFGLPVFDGTGDPWLLQLRATRNIDLPPALSWTFVGLDHQVEHHLFPRMSHRRMKVASPVFRAWAEKKGVPYQSLRLWPSLVEATRFMERAWNEAPVPVSPENATEGIAPPAACEVPGSVEVQAPVGLLAT